MLSVLICEVANRIVCCENVFLLVLDSSCIVPSDTLFAVLPSIFSYIALNDFEILFVQKIA